LIVPPALATVPETVNAPLPDPSVPLLVPPIQLTVPPKPATRLPVLVTAVVAPNVFVVALVVKLPAKAPPFTTALPNVTEWAPVEVISPLFVTAPSSVPFWTVAVEPITNEPPAMFEIVPPVLLTIAAPLRDSEAGELLIAIPDSLNSVPPVTRMLPLLAIEFTVAPLPVRSKVEFALPLVIVKVTPLLMVNAVYSLPLIVSESSERPVVASTGASLALLRPPGKVTSAPDRAVDIGAVQAPPPQLQSATVLQLLLDPAPVQVTVDALNCRFHISNIVAAKRNVMLDRQFF